MIPSSIWDICRQSIFRVKLTDSLFNQYSDTDPDLDLPNAHEIRCQNLQEYLASYHRKPQALVIGEMATTWGSRFSGVPQTSERQLISGDLPFDGKQSSLDDPAIRTRVRPPYSATSATIFWKVMASYHPNFLVWDFVPIYPHVGGNMLKKRTPKAEEMEIFADSLTAVIAAIQPKLVVAIGKRVSEGIANWGVTHESVHHPTHDAAGEFAAGMKAIFLDIV